MELEESFNKKSKGSIPDEVCMLWPYVGQELHSGHTSHSYTSYVHTCTHAQILGDFSAESASVGKREEEEEEEKVLSKEEEYRFYDRPKDYIGPISEIVKKLPEGMQITRVQCNESYTLL